MEQLGVEFVWFCIGVLMLLLFSCSRVISRLCEKDLNPRDREYLNELERVLEFASLVFLLLLILTILLNT